MLFALKMTFVVIPGGPPVFSHGAVAPWGDLSPKAPVAAGVLWSVRIGTIRIAAAIASPPRRLYGEFSELACTEQIRRLQVYFFSFSASCEAMCCAHVERYKNRLKSCK